MARALYLLIAVIFSRPINADIQTDRETGHPLNLPGGRLLWTSGINGRFADIPSHELHNVISLDTVFDVSNVPVKQSTNQMGHQDTFDVTEQWPECAKTVLTVRDQGVCGGWASTLAAVMSDLTCIRCRGKVSPNLSEQDLLSCSNAGDCNRANLTTAFEYWAQVGLVSGGAHGSKSGCLPNVHSPRDGRQSSIPACPNACRWGFPRSFAKDKHRGDRINGASSNIISNNPSELQSALKSFGPVVAIMSVYEDFIYNYTSGIYHHVFGKRAGVAAVKVIGWGLEGGIPYWLAVNNWGSDWGMKGLFKILRDGKESYFGKQVIVSPGSAVSSCFSPPMSQFLSIGMFRKDQSSTTSTTRKTSTSTTSTTTKSTTTSTTSTTKTSTSSSSTRFSTPSTLSTSKSSTRSTSSSTTRYSSGSRYFIQPFYLVCMALIALIFHI